MASQCLYSSEEESWNCILGFFLELLTYLIVKDIAQTVSLPTDWCEMFPDQYIAAVTVFKR